ncbi:hypothetical protein ACL07V_32925 [Streptomyces sp. MB22_4]|uniref:hypothetical protein n=1 Tax=Streptomyces sp. MB22_4 TaxID=3383120 RepID=UPI0039A28471
MIPHAPHVVQGFATRLAARAAAHDVTVALQRSRTSRHVVQGFAGFLGEGATAPATSGAFLRARLRAPGDSPC